jgi:hypothetical protein
MLLPGQDVTLEAVVRFWEVLYDMSKSRYEEVKLAYEAWDRDQVWDGTVSLTDWTVLHGIRAEFSTWIGTGSIMFAAQRTVLSRIS